MATPSAYAITITIDGVDVTQYCPVEEIYFEDYLMDVSSFRFKCENPSGVTPARNGIVQVIANDLAGTPIVFSGIIVEIESRKRDNGITKEYMIDAADYKIYLQKSILAAQSFSGSDADILSDLLGNTYPDLSGLFDFTTDVTSFQSNLSFSVNDESLLDALKRFRDLTGANMRFKREKSANQTITNEIEDSIAFEGSSVPRWQDGGNVVGVTSGIQATGGNPDGCWEATAASLTTTNVLVFTIRMANSGSYTLENVTFDYYLDASGIDAQWEAGSAFANSIAVVGDGTWRTVNWKTSFPSITWGSATFVYNFMQFTVNSNYGSPVTLRIDNIKFTTSPHFVEGDPIDNLNWGLDPDVAPFDFDIGSGDEFGFDFDLVQGDYDDYNSIVVIGGNENVAIDWVYEGNGIQDHFDLELPVDGITVYENTGSDGSPTWTALDDGIFGTDELTGDGGTKDVLYDTDFHWLLFDSAPPNFMRSFRVTGTIKKPIRVLVENVQGSDPTFVTTLYDDTITSEQDAVALAQSQLNKRNQAKRLNFTTYEPLLEVGQAIQVLDSARGLNETLTIHTIKTTWLGGGAYAKFEVEAGELDLTKTEVLLANMDKRSREKAYQQALTTPTIAILQDSDGLNLLDSSGSLLYEVA